MEGCTFHLFHSYKSMPRTLSSCRRTYSGWTLALVTGPPAVSTFITTSSKAAPCGAEQYTQIHTNTARHMYSTLAQWQVCMDTYYYIDTTTSDAILSFCVTYAQHPQARLLLSGCAPAECSSAKAYMVPPVEMCPGPVALCTCACTRTLQQGCAALVQARPLASPDTAVKPSAAHYTTMMVIS